MTLEQSLEEMLREIAGMDAEQCVRELIDFSALPLDFQPDYLKTRDVHWLRHVLAAAVITTIRHRSAA
jgi:hypothetical protein